MLPVSGSMHSPGNLRTSTVNDQKQNVANIKRAWKLHEYFLTLASVTVQLCYRIAFVLEYFQLEKKTVQKNGIEQCNSEKGKHVKCKKNANDKCKFEKGKNDNCKKLRVKNVSLRKAKMTIAEKWN